MKALEPDKTPLTGALLFAGMAVSYGLGLSCILIALFSISMSSG